MPGNFSQAWLPVLASPTPRGVRSNPMNTTLNSTSHFHFFSTISMSTMDISTYMQKPNSMAMPWTPTYLSILVAGSI